ncbi:MAG: hypothetical protein IPK70_08495 [Flavobacteriales bacterium]|nr:hypothetical protein [Flavobacteriales bacterium]
MERREHYDPEDIESLLQQRAFDELLDEERAYVLRHLSGRDEYEAMRALLNDVRDHDRRREPISADPQLRADLMGIFRAQHRPQWQIWLNSVGTFIWPKETSDLWRPALAFASLALLITAGVWVLRNGDDHQPQLAELKQEAAKPEVPVKPAAAEAPVDPDADSKRDGHPQAEARSDRAPDEQIAVRKEEAQAPGVMDVATDAAEEELAMKEDAAVSQVALEQESAMDAASTMTGTAAPSIVKHTTAASESLTSGSRVVTVNELAANQSMANAAGKVATNSQAANQAATAISNAPEVMALFASGW